ncbi:MAG: hypothetical protein M9894_08740 [Planctomycetes bacterium]|nr:hypothetical protein [Planctomycetota bacterium]
MNSRASRWLLLFILLGGCRSFDRPADGPAPRESLFGEELAADVLDGDIVLRAGVGADSDLIRQLTGSRWSHSGLIVRVGADTYVIDNYPGRSGGSIARISIAKFFQGATDGGVWRYTPSRTVPAGASAWAQAQIGAGYEFDLIDRFTNGNRVQYCSEFVWRAYRSGGDDLVPAPLNVKGPNLDATRRALIDYGKAEASFFQRPFVKAEVDRLLDAHDGLFIAPGQLDSAPQTDRMR